MPARHSVNALQCGQYKCVEYAAKDAQGIVQYAEE